MRRFRVYFAFVDAAGVRGLGHQDILATRSRAAKRRCPEAIKEYWRREGITGMTFAGVNGCTEVEAKSEKE